MAAVAALAKPVTDIFSGPKYPAVEAAPLPPAQNKPDLVKQDEESLKAARRAASGGSASQILTSPLGVVGDATDARKLARLYLG